MTDKELLELAAKAAGIEICGWSDSADAFICREKSTAWWNPLRLDGDALRLAVKLHINLNFYEDAVKAHEAKSDRKRRELFASSSPCEATRRSIVRAAAEIGRTTE